jgi:hypothetical protein
LLWLKKFAGRAELSNPLPRSEAMQRLCAVFNAEAERSHKRFYKRTKLDYIDYNDPNVHYKTEEMDAVAIHIPVHRVDDFLDMFTIQKYREMEIRDQVPAVKKAYEHYKMLLKMCGVDDARY